MKTYTKVNVPEATLEDLVRQDPGLIEEGLVYVDHQKPAAGGRLDVLLVDSGNTLVVAELKVVEDDGMLMQGVDYYDYLTEHVETFARLYNQYEIDATKKPRLLLIAPSFSQRLITRCRWVRVPVSLFTYSCLAFKGEEDVTPVYEEQPIPAFPEPIEILQIADHLAYITDAAARSRAETLLKEVKSWQPQAISLDAIKNGISMKASGKVFAYLWTYRKHFSVSAFDSEGQWADHMVKDEESLGNVLLIMKMSLQQKGDS